jgi:zinc protease
MIRSYFKYNENMNDPKNFDNIVNSMSKKNIQEMAKQVFEGGGKSYEVVFKPKQSNEIPIKESKKQ